MANNANYPVWPGWETVRLIGRGSFGAVYEVRRDTFKDGEEEHYAVKHIAIPQRESEIDALRSRGLNDGEITSYFQTQAREIANEYKLLMRLNDCPNVVNGYDVHYVQHKEDPGCDLFIRMELLTPLLKYLSDHPNLQEEQIIKIAKDLCQALVYCRKKKVLHRDIKPENIFVSDEGIFKLGDFGVARVKTGTGTETGKIGTLDYMAPEVYHNHRSYGGEVDIYSLGVVLYWLLNRQCCPFQPTDKLYPSFTDKEKARDRRFAGEELPPPLNGSKELKRIVLKACAYDPADRYQNAEEMLRDLDALSTPDAPRRTTPPTEPPAPRPAPIEAEKPEPTEGMFGDRSNPEPGPTERGTIGMFGGGSNVEPDAPRRTTPPTESPAPQPAPIEREKPEPIERGTVGVFDRKFEPEEETPPAKKTPWGLIIGIVAALLALLVIGFFTIHSYDPATCTEPKTCKICGKTEGEALGHQWGGWTVVTEPTCTEEGLRERICLNDTAHQETEAIPAAGHTWKDATCTEPSVCTVCGAESEGPIGHDWAEPTYTWSSDNSAVTAKRICKNDSTHVESENVKTSSRVTTAATCTTKGKTTYTATFSNSAFSTQTKAVENIAATGHKWGSVSYTWSADNSSCTAKHTCSVCGKTESETAKSTSRVTTAATCTTKGQTTYTATFSNSAFSTQTKAVENIAATGHKWGSVSYTWSGTSSCTAKHTCSVCNKTETETASTSSKVTTAATSTKKGKTTYTATFSNSAFSAQTKTVEDIPATGISPASPSSAPTASPVEDFEYKLTGGSILIRKYVGRDTEVSIPSTIEGKTVTIIGDYAFLRCSSLSEITIPVGVTSIYIGAFGGCSSLRKITIPTNVKFIGESAFSGCSSLTTITIPAGVASIEDYVFSWCGSLSEITIPTSVMSIGAHAFDECSSLTDVYYSGSQQQWRQISIGSGNTALTSATIHYNSK